MFESVYKEIYPDELELKVEHSGSHASFLNNLDISINVLSATLVAERVKGVAALSSR